MKAFLFLMLSLFATFVYAANTNRVDVVYDSPTNRVVSCGWVNVDPTHYLAGAKTTAENLNSRVVVVHRWCIACPKVEGAIKEFTMLSKQYDGTGIEFLTSYYPGSPHPRSDVMKAISSNKIVNSVYIGAAPQDLRLAHDHRALYVVGPNAQEVWSIKNNNIDIKELSKVLNEKKAELISSVIVANEETAPGLSLMLAKKYKKICREKNDDVERVIKTMTPKADVRSMADLEEKVEAYRKKPDEKTRKTLIKKLQALSSKPDVASEAEALLSELEQVTSLNKGKGC